MAGSKGWQGFWSGEIFDRCLYFEDESGQEGDGRARAAVVETQRGGCSPRPRDQTNASNFAPL
eukprot:scaffold9386_cov154-Ochromonas_danica.AAC.10